MIAPVPRDSGTLVGGFMRHGRGNPWAAMALLAAGVAYGLIDGIYGPWAWPDSVRPGGKREHGAVVGAGVMAARLFGTAAVLWMGAAILAAMRGTSSHAHGVPWATAIWATVLYGLAHVAMKALEAAAIVAFRLTTLDIYPLAATFGMMGTLAALAGAARGVMPDSDWLAVIPLVVPAFLLGTFAPYAVAVAVPPFLLWRRLR